MQNAIRHEGRRVLGAVSSVAEKGASSDRYEAIPGKDRLTVRAMQEETQRAATPDADAPKAHFQAYSANSFPTEPLLDTEQAAAIMRIHPKTLQKLARRGVIRALQIGKVWRFRASVLDEWIEQQLAG